MTPATYPDAIFIRHQNRFVKIRIADIAYLEARKNYCKVVTATESYLTLCTLKRMRELLPAAHFVQTHRAYLVAVTWNRAFDNRTVYGPDQTLPIGESFRKELSSKVLVAGPALPEPELSLV